MDLLNTKYIILELIPTAISKDKGDIVQLSALKLDGIKLIDRFDYRLNEDKITIKEFIDMCSYDKDSFTYVDSTEVILSEFKKWIGDLPLLIISNQYTINFLGDIDNSKEDILKYLDMNISDDVIEKIMRTYKLEPTNYIVDLLYEALIIKIS